MKKYAEIYENNLLYVFKKEQLKNTEKDCINKTTDIISDVGLMLVIRSFRGRTACVRSRTFQRRQ